MTEDELDPVIHAPARLRLMVTLAALPEGDDLSFTRLQDITGLTPGNLITHLRKLEAARYARMVKTAEGTAVSLTPEGRAALQRYTVTLRGLLDAAGQTQPQLDPHAPGLILGPGHADVRPRPAGRPSPRPLAGAPDHALGQQELLQPVLAPLDSEPAALVAAERGMRA
jgi:DNA-binding MarR family transcriptional regulator